MVVRIQLIIKHIRGHTFPIETDVDSEVVGLKVQIWESQKIPIENQRLVFSGKELADDVTLSQMNIGDNATIFLVESMSDVPQQPQAEIPQVTIQVPVQVTPMGDPNASVCQQQCAVATNAVPVNVNYYEPLEVETALSEERIQSVMDLAFWVRLYCIFAFVVSIICSFATLYSLIPLIIYICGYFGTRKVNRWLLVLLLLWTAILGFAYTIVVLYHCFTNFNGVYIGALFFGLMHIIIFVSICKLMTRIRKLTCQEWIQTRIRIRAKRRCF